ncbi:MAG: four helix bundle protein [Algoriphagus sp.]|nr:four helix bundle protein [Algoriphagus sp.]
MGFKELLAYQKAFKLAMEIFQLSKSFPREEKHSLTNQIRRSSSSVCVCIAESYRKRKYQAHFISKLSDADMEKSETHVWLEFAFSCEYIERVTHERLVSEVIEIGKLLSFMILNPEKFGSKLQPKS